MMAATWTSNDEAVAEMGALRLLAAVIDSNPNEAATAVEPLIDDGGDRSWRHAWRTVDEMAIVWSIATPDAADAPAGVVLPLMRGILGTSVPADLQARVWATYRPVRAALRTGRGSFRPVRTADPEADLWMVSVFATYFAMQTADAREQLGTLLKYLQQPDRTISAAELTPTKHAAANRRTRELLGKIPLSEIADGSAGSADPRIGPTIADRLLAAAHDSTTNPLAMAQVKRIGTLARVYTGS